MMTKPVPACVGFGGFYRKTAAGRQGKGMRGYLIREGN